MSSKIIILSLALLSCFAVAQDFTLKQGLISGIIPFHDDYILSLAKEYNPSITKLHSEFKNFKDNLLKVIEHQKNKEATYTLSIDGPFAFISDEEFFQNFTGSQDCSATAEQTLRNPMRLQSNGAEAPAFKNWTALNKVSPVKDQQSCGSCWTFSSTGAIESHYAIIEDVEPLSLSEQQLVDCAQAFNNFGCSGGLPSQAFEYIKHVGGIAFENSYPYIATEEECVFDPTTVGARVSGGSFNITQGDEEQLKNAVGNVGPVSIAFQVMGDFKLYTSGVYSNPACSSSPQDVNHAVLATGYGVDEEGAEYWYVKNSWSEYWGDNGYFKIQRGKNMCGVATCASYPLLNNEDSELDSIFNKQSQVSA